MTPPPQPSFHPRLDEAHACLASAVAALTMASEEAIGLLDVISLLELAKMLTEAQRRLLNLSSDARWLAAAKGAPPPRKRGPRQREV